MKKIMIAILIGTMTANSLVAFAGTNESGVYEGITEEVKLMELGVQRYRTVSKVIDGNTTSYTYDTRNTDQITAEFEKELNEKEKSRNASSGSIELQLASKQRKSTGFKKFAKFRRIV